MTKTDYSNEYCSWNPIINSVDVERYFSLYNNKTNGTERFISGNNISSNAY